MFFKKQPHVVYLQKESLVVYSKNHPDGVEFTYPEKTIKNYEITNTNKFSDALETFVAENLIDENSTIVVLGADTFDQKKLESTASEDQQKEVEKFIKETGIKEENLLRETFELDNNRFIFIIDKRIYEPILQQLVNLGWKITSVIPISLFRDLQDSKMKKNGLNLKELKDIQGNDKLVKDANLVSVLPTTQPKPAEQAPKETESNADATEETKESPPPSPVPAQKSSSANLIILSAIVIILLGALAFLYTQGIFDSVLKQTPAEVKQEEPAPTATPTPVETEEDKEKLTVKILNGTGVVGQAGRVKTRLEALDYSEIEAENSDTEENTETQITFSPKVPKEYQEEIVEDLEKIFETVKNEVKDGEDADIVILTGTEKE